MKYAFIENIKYSATVLYIINEFFAILLLEYAMNIILSQINFLMNISINFIMHVCA